MISVVGKLKPRDCKPLIMQKIDNFLVGFAVVRHQDYGKPSITPECHHMFGRQLDANLLANRVVVVRRHQ